jgi:hypothetical protein
MAVTLDAYGVDGAGFVNNAYSADWSGCETVVAAVAGKSIYITHLTIHCIAAITVTLGAGETGGAVTAELFGPVTFAATAGAPIEIPFYRPLKLATATALVADASGAGAMTIMAQGYIK